MRWKRNTTRKRRKPGYEIVPNFINWSTFSCSTRWSTQNWRRCRRTVALADNHIMTRTVTPNKFLWQFQHSRRLFLQRNAVSPLLCAYCDIRLQHWEQVPCRTTRAFWAERNKREEWIARNRWEKGFYSHSLYRWSLFCLSFPTSLSVSYFQGEPCLDVIQHHRQIQTCQYCPAGQQGLPGLPGNQGDSVINLFDKF